MRERTLSNEGLHLYLNCMTPPKPAHWTKKIFCNLFHSDYDDRLDDVVYKCRESTKAILAEFDNPDIGERLDAGITHTIRLILTRDNKKVKNRHIQRSFRFFLDVMRVAYEREDHQTAHMIWLSLTHPAIYNLQLKKPKWGNGLLKEIEKCYGTPLYEKHINYWTTVRTDNPLPSLIAFHRFITRREFSGKMADAQYARDMMDIFKYLEHSADDILPIYRQRKLSKKEMAGLSASVCK